MMRSIRKKSAFHLLGSLLVSLASAVVCAEGQTLVVSAEGLADPEAETYQRDRGLMLEDLRKDARRQAIEKAVGTLVESSTLVENYELIEDRVMTKSAGLIKRVIKQSDPWIGEDGFAHLLLKAEVYLGDVRETLESMSRESRVSLIRQQGDPRIAVAVVARDASRGALEERSNIAENILKEHIKAYGYRVWSDQWPAERAGSAEGEGSGAFFSPVTGDTADFRILGKARFQRIDLTLPASGLSITKYKLTSWSVKCIDTSTGEEIYFNNQVPHHGAWASEDQALHDIGQLIGDEFSQDFFQNHLIKPSRIYQMQVSGLPDYDSGRLLKKELIGLRSVLNVDLRSFDAEGRSLMEVDFAGSTGNFSDRVNASVIKPLNAKAGEELFKLEAIRGSLVEIAYQGSMSGEELAQRFSSMPPASLAEATEQRLQEVVKSETAREKVAAMRSGLEAPTEGELLRKIGDF